MRRAVVALSTVALAVSGLVLVSAPAQALPVCTGYTSFYGGYRVPSYPTNKMDCELRYGDTGEGVKQLQRILNSYCNASQGLTVDGQFGPRTRDALKAVQRAYGISVDGIYGPQTRGTLYYQGYDGWCRPYSSFSTWVVV